MIICCVIRVAPEDVREVVAPGNHVLVRTQLLAKLDPKWKGPWLVLRLLGLHDLAAEVLNGNRHTMVVAIANVKLWWSLIPSCKWRWALVAKVVKCMQGVPHE